MICIWATSATLTWGVMSLRSIVLNMHVWASRALKPMIQACVYQVSRCLSLATPLPTSRITNSSDERLQRAEFGDQSATSFIRKSRVAETPAETDILTENFESITLTDKRERRQRDEQHFSGVENYENTESPRPSTHTSKDTKRPRKFPREASARSRHSVKDARAERAPKQRVYSKPKKDCKLDNSTRDCSDTDGCSYPPSESNFQLASQSDEDSESDTSDGDENSDSVTSDPGSFDSDSSHGGRDYSMKQNRKSPMRSRSRSGERRTPSSSTKLSTLNLSPEDRWQIRTLGRSYRVYAWDM
jgi:hypothetical protein